MADSIMLINLTEKVSLHYQGKDADSPEVGDSDTYDDVLFDGDGREVGTVTGRGKIAYRRPTDDHVMVHYQEEIVLPDGAITTTGWIDGYDVAAGNWQMLSATGASGRYVGWVGVRMFRVREPHKVMQTSIFLFS